MKGRPESTEAAPYYHGYINQISGDNILDAMESQLEETTAFLRGISEEKSLQRYAPEKWSMRQLLSHVNDCERVLLFRAFWFARGFQEPLPSYDQDICVLAARTDDLSWASHVDEFRQVRRASLTFFQNLPADAWMRKGIAGDNSFTVRALAYILAGHVSHHTSILQGRYL